MIKLTWLGMLPLKRGEFETALQAEEMVRTIIHTPDTIMRHSVIFHALGPEQEAAQLIED